VDAKVILSSSQELKLFFATTEKSVSGGTSGSGLVANLGDTGVDFAPGLEKPRGISDDGFREGMTRRPLTGRPDDRVSVYYAKEGSDDGEMEDHRPCKDSEREASGRCYDGYEDDVDGNSDKGCYSCLSSELRRTHEYV
jgi:hypothetical protein